jgi:hypothetical protein
MEVWAILGVLSTIIGVLLTIYLSAPAPAPPAQINQFIVNVESDKLNQLPLPLRGPCFCGSGKRYKNCHGRTPGAGAAVDPRPEGWT